MLDQLKIDKFITGGYSVFLVDSKKHPLGKWAILRTEPYTTETFPTYLSRANNGKISKVDKDKSTPEKPVYEVQTPWKLGTATGVNGLEVIDVDLKVFNTAKEKKAFWDSLLGLLRETIFDFDEKVVIYKTISEGYHILYRSDNIQGNLKLSIPSHTKEASIETRGTGGYVVLYDTGAVTDKTYHDITKISNEDRNLIISTCKIFDCREQTTVVIPKKTITEYETTGLTSWDDYNNKTQVTDLIGAEFSIISEISDKLIIKRHGATSPHSGYIYKDNGCMYLFSTGTAYPHETQLSPFAVYTYQKHNGDFSASAKELYHKGYGERMKLDPPKPNEPEEVVKINKDDLIFPLDIFPSTYVDYITQCNQTLGAYTDYMGCALIFNMSLLIGNSHKIQVKSGWIEAPSLWLALVGKAGIGKTPSISNITKPLQKIQKKQIKEYIKNREKFDAFELLSKKDKELSEQVKEPVRVQFLVDDTTIEALMDLHSQVPNGVGIYKDELAGWIADMNKYRAGSDLQHWLSSWNNQQISLNRKTAKSALVDSAFMPVMGGIQPAVIEQACTDENKANGFTDRLLISYPDIDIASYTEDEIDESYLEWYENEIVGIYDTIKNMTKYNDEGEIIPFIAHWTKDARVEWIRINREIETIQRSDNENEYMKSMYPKQKSYIPRFALILNVLSAFSDNSGTQALEITKKSILDAEKLSKYFVAMSKKIKVDSSESSKLKKMISTKENGSSFDQFKTVYIKGGKNNITKIAELLSISRQTAYKYKAKIDEL
jgi:hypothetical protein